MKRPEQGETIAVWFSCGAAATCTKRLGTVYMPKDVALRLVDDLNSGRVVLWSGN